MPAGFAGLLLLAACQGAGSSPSPSTSASEDGGTSSAPIESASAEETTGAELSGELVISGSSTVEPITSIVAEDFAAENPDVSYSVDGPGTGDGFALFCNGETDISDASRAIKDEEAAACDEAGIGYVGLQIGIDGLSVITSPENADVTCLSFGDLYALVGPESQGFANWSDADGLAGEIGSDFGEIHAPYPDVPLEITAPGEESGTFDTFVELALGDALEARGNDGTTRPDYQASADDNVIIENIGGVASSLGWVGFAFADESSDTVKSLEVDGGDGCVAPTPETIASNEYPLSRPLFIYVNTDKATENPALAAFVDYYLSDEGIAAVEEADYVALEPNVLDETRSAWEGR